MPPYSPVPDHLAHDGGGDREIRRVDNVGMQIDINS
jgi:hypothetical protein